MSTVVDTPVPNEAVARELSRVEPEQQAKVWQEAVKKADGVPTQKIVEQVIEAHAAKASPEKCPTCGATERDDEGDCAKCKEPLGSEPEKPASKPPSKKAKAKKKALDSLGVLIRAMDELGIYNPKWAGVFKELKAAIGHAK